MTRRFGSVVATAARALAGAAIAMLAACGQKGALIGGRPAPPPIAAELAPDTAVAVPASAPAAR